ncbi:MAG: TRAP transporter fused permease subunit [Deltaproteobacteria bacterium]|nr:TRAP transporter fused permease subunit [Deltaproteobacteria bacterium]
MKLPLRLPRIIGIALCLFTVAEVNYPRLSPQSQLAIFAGAGLVLCFLRFPLHPSWKAKPVTRALDGFLALLAGLCSLFVVIQTEPRFQSWWLGGHNLGERAGAETTLDLVVGAVGLTLVLEAARRTVGYALPVLSGLFLAYAALGPELPGWLFPHKGYGAERIVAQTFLHSQGVFGIALRVMFTYVFLFVLLGALLELTGATKFVLDTSRRIFRRSPGGAAKVAVLSSGLMGSLSGSAVANTATTGTFTIPMMRSSGFRPSVAGGIEAAASSGGALAPPVMGAGAYMMLEIIQPAVTYVQIIRAALIPAVLYYLSLFLIVHFRSRKVQSQPSEDLAGQPLRPYAGFVFGAAFASLIAFLLAGFSPFRAVTVALATILLLASFHATTRFSFERLTAALEKASKDMVPLICAAACVGVILGVVTLTGVGNRLPSTLLTLAQDNLLLALGTIMISSLILGMGLPSAVCYLLLATLVGPALQGLGVVPLAAHLFIFYFGMMSMVTPPVALAAYTAASIAGSGILKTAFAAFRFALVGFTLPYMFVLRPELLMLNQLGDSASVGAITLAVTLAVLGIVPFAAGVAGYFLRPLSPIARGILLVASALLLLPGPGWAVAGITIPWVAAGGAVLLFTSLWSQVAGHPDKSFS